MGDLEERVLYTDRGQVEGGGGAEANEMSQATGRQGMIVVGRHGSTSNAVVGKKRSSDWGQ